MIRVCLVDDQTLVRQGIRSLLALDGDRLGFVPSALGELAREHHTSLDNYLALDDSVMWTALSGFRNEKDPILSDLSHRLVSRNLLKAHELFGDDATREGRTRCLHVAQDLARQAGFDESIYVGLDVPSVQVFDDTKDGLSVVFPDSAERRPTEVSFLLGRLKGQTLVKPRIIYPAEIRDALHAALGKSDPA